MKLLINSAEFVAPEPYTVAQMIKDRNLQQAGTAVAVNGKLVPSIAWAEHHLHDNDQILIISAAYGG